jgi:hypothetical protein
VFKAPPEQTHDEVIHVIEFYMLKIMDANEFLYLKYYESYDLYLIDQGIIVPNCK